MAYMTIADFRTYTGVTSTSLPDASAGRFLSAASAFLYAITGRVIGSLSESMTQNGVDVDVVSYGHGLPGSGLVYVANSGSGAFDGVYDFTRVDRDTIKLIGVTLGSVTSCTLCPQFTADYDVMESRVRVFPAPIAFLDEVRIDSVYGSTAARFDTNTILEDGEYYVAQEANQLYVREIEILPGRASKVLVRQRGLINPIRVSTRRRARVRYYAGCTGEIPQDLAIAVASMAKSIAEDPSGQMQSESLDYYSYSRMSISEAAQLPFSIISTLARYRI